MLNKIKISGDIVLETGMHIGASDAFAAIGAIDSPVIRDAVSDLPYIPGSSLKGKLRSLLAKKYNERRVKTRDEDADEIKRLFGASKFGEKNYPKNSRLIFTDSILSNEDELKSKGIKIFTEEKNENTINPFTSVANPRNIERVIRGAKFPVDIIYNVEETEEVLEDMKVLVEGFNLLKYDYIGGHGSRGYGRVRIDNLKAEAVIGQDEIGLVEKCNELLKEV